MATQYTPILQLALPVTGELNGTWGDVVNDNITSMVEQAIAGMATISTWTANSHTLTTANGTSDEARCAMLLLQTGAGGTALTGTGQVICPSLTKLYVVKNASAYAVTIKTAAGTGISVAAGDTTFVFCDGTNVVACVTQITNGHITGNLIVDGTTTLNDTATTETILPATDNTYDLGSSGASWRNLYVDGTAAIATLNATTVDTTNIEVTNLKAKDGTAAGSIADSTGVVTINSAVLTTADINGGTVDNATIGATTASTGRFTQVNITGQGDLRLEDTTGGEYVALQAPASLASSYTLTMPADDGTNGQALITDGSGNLSWSTAASGDVYGPASATNTAVALFDGTTGKLIKNSGVTIDGSNNVSGVAQLNATTVDLTNLEVTNIKAKDGTQAIAIADSTGAITLSTGTANGVAYLNGSKVLTTGSALTFDGTNFATTGSATATALIPSGATVPTNGLFLPAANTVGWATNSAEKMRLDSSGNLGLGVTPSAWLSSAKVAQIGPCASLWSLSTSLSRFSTNAYTDTGGTTRYINTAAAADYRHSNGSHEWYTAPSGTAGNAISFTHAMTLDASGNLGVGVTSPSYRLHIYGSDANSAKFQTTTNASLIRIQSTSSEIAVGNDTTGGFITTLSSVPLILKTNDTERMRIDSSGNVGIGTSSPTQRLDVRTAVAISDGTVNFVAGAGAFVGGQFGLGTTTNHLLAFATNNTERMRIDSNGNLLVGTTSGGTSARINVAGGAIQLADGQPIQWGGQSSYWTGYGASNLLLAVTNGSERMRITSGGEVYIAGTTDQGAYNLQCNGTGVWGAGAYVNGSDAALKENVTTLDNSLGLINAMRPVTFTYKENYSKDRAVQTGFIAQELQEVLAGKDYLDGIVQAGPEHLNVAYQNLIPLLVKAVQELTARVAQLEGN